MMGIFRKERGAFLAILPAALYNPFIGSVFGGKEYAVLLLQELHIRQHREEPFAVAFGHDPVE